MFSRTAFRSSRYVLRAPVRLRVNVSIRSNSTSPAVKQGATSGAVTGGLIGGAVALGIGYGYYHFSGAKTIVQTAKATKAQIDEITNSMKQKAPEPSQALGWLKSTASSYAVFIPGAKKYVDGAFDQLEAVEKKHGDKVGKIASNAYTELAVAVNEEGSLSEKTQKTWQILEKHLKQLGELASDAASDILDNHPEIKDKVGGNIDQLKALGEKYGPEAKKQVDETWKQISDIIKGGVNSDTTEKIRKLVEDRTNQVKKAGDELYKKGMEQAKPLLDKSPQAKELVEKNADALKDGNVVQLYIAIKESVSSGNMDQLEKYIKEATDSAKKGSGGVTDEVQKYAKMIPGADKILPKLSQLQEAAKKHGAEAESILKDTYKEIEDVLARRTGQAEKLAEKAKKEAQK